MVGLISSFKELQEGREGEEEGERYLKVIKDITLSSSRLRCPLTPVCAITWLALLHSPEREKGEATLHSGVIYSLLRREDGKAKTHRLPNKTWWTFEKVHNIPFKIYHYRVVSEELQPVT